MHIPVIYSVTLQAGEAGGCNDIVMGSDLANTLFVGSRIIEEETYTFTLYHGQRS